MPGLIWCMRRRPFGQPLNPYSNSSNNNSSSNKRPSLSPIRSNPLSPLAGSCRGSRFSLHFTKILLLSVHNSADAEFAPWSLPMKKLVLESTSPFQGLPELVAYDEGLFEKEGLIIEWADRDEAGIKVADTSLTDVKGADPFVSHGTLLEQGKSDMYS